MTETTKDYYIEYLEADIKQLNNKIHNIEQTPLWKTKTFFQKIKKVIRNFIVFRLIIKFFISLKNNDIKYTFRLVLRKFGINIKNKHYYKKQDFKTYIKTLDEKQKEIANKYPNAAEQIIHLKARNEIFTRCSEPKNGDVKFSILVPLYNTDGQMLKEMIESVLIQSYTNFELCLGDGSDNEHSYIEQICKEYAENDNRIIYKKLEKNLGISGNTNACIEMATGDFISLFDHDDFLHPFALEKTFYEIQKGADFVYTDEGTFEEKIGNIIFANYKPDFAPDTLYSINYICHFSTFKKSLLDICGGAFNSKYDGAQDHDLILRLTDKAKKIAHIKELLYFWRSHPASAASSVSAKPYAYTAGVNAVHDFLENKGFNTEVSNTDFLPTAYRVKYEILGNPLVSIIIPNKDHIDNLKKCLDSIFNKSTYKNFEIIICENNSTEEKTFAYYKELENNKNVKIITWEKEFNYSAINNFAVKFAKGDFLLLLNNDTEVIEPRWIEELLMYAQRKDVGCAGAKLLYENNKIQHAGVIINHKYIAIHRFLNLDKNESGYMHQSKFVQDLSAVTGACVMIRKDVWQQIGGFNEEYAIAYNDIDFCMKIHKNGYLIVYNPFCILYHHESMSRGYEDTLDKKLRRAKEAAIFRSNWEKELKDGDPYYNINFSLEKNYIIEKDNKIGINQPY